MKSTDVAGWIVLLNVRLEAGTTVSVVIKFGESVREEYEVRARVDHRVDDVGMRR